MNKLLLKVNHDYDLNYSVNGFILGLEGFSICFNKTFNIEEIIDVLNNNKDKEIYVALNRPIFNYELDKYKEILKKLDSLGLAGIIAGDVSILTYNLNTNIIIDQLHLNNSSNTVKHFSNNGANGIVLTNDITLDEINNIVKNNDIKTYLNVLGYSHLSTSKRSLVTNYLDTFNIEKKSNIHLIKEKVEDSYYFVVEDYFGTHILNGNLLNLLEKKDLINTDYLIIDSFLIDPKEDLDVMIDAYLKNDNTLLLNLKDKYNMNEGFIDTRTIYKVKNHE